MSYVVKQLWRSPLKTLLFILLLAAVGMAMVVGAGLWVNAQINLTNADKSFTTVAMPNEPSVALQSGITKLTSSWEDPHAYRLAIREYSQIRKNVISAGLSIPYAKPDSRRILRGYSPGMSTVMYTSGGSNFIAPHDYIIYYGECLDSVVRTDEFDGEFSISENAAFRVEEVLAKHSLQETYPWLLTTSFIYDTEGWQGKQMFEPGKKYLIAARQSTNQNYQYDFDIDTGELEYVWGKWDIINSCYFIYASDLKSPEIDTSDRDLTPDEQASLLKNYYSEVEGDIDEFLADPQNIRWQQLIDEAQYTYNALDAITTGNHMTLEPFNRRTAALQEGREITEKEYEEGAAVCMIHAAMAYLNDIKIGDKIDLSFYQSSFQSFYRAGGGMYWLADPYVHGTPISEKKEYEVVGVYTVPLISDPGYYSFTPNTVIVPDKSVDYDYVSSFDDLSLNPPAIQFAFTMSNDDGLRFAKDADAMGTYGKLFMLEDQGYSGTIGALRGMSSTSGMIFVLGFAAWLLVSAFFLMMFVQGRSKEAGIMLSLGAGKKKALRSLMLTAIAVTLIACAISGIVGGLLFDNIGNAIFNYAKESESGSSFYTSPIQTTRLSQEAQDELLRDSTRINNKAAIITAACAVQVLLTTVAAYIMAQRVVKKSPMYLVKG